MKKISFEMIESEVRFLNPLKGFEEDVHTLQIRKDPLLGDTSVFNPYLKDKAKAFFGDCDTELIKRLVEETAKNCFFCGEGVENSTPRFSPDFLQNGRIRFGEAILFPNLFSLGTYHPVVRLCNAHFLQLSEFTPAVLYQGFIAAREFFQTAYTRDQQAAYGTVTANYLFPAGASLVHPHLQMLLSPVPYTYLSRVAEASRIWHRNHGSVYFTELIETEKNHDRYVGRIGKWHWLSPFSPQGNNEVLAIHEDARDFGNLADEDIQDLSAGISRTLSLYESLGHLSFNYALYSIREDQDHGGFRCFLRIITRQNLYPNYRNDDYFLQKLLQSELIIMPPEELAGQLRKFFTG